MSASRRSHLPSGWRRTTPEAVARRVGEDAVEGFPVPPRRRVAGVAQDDAHARRIQAQAGEIFADARETRLVTVERNELDVGELDDVRGLAAGRGARVERTLVRREAQQCCRELRAEVLHREGAVGIARELGDRPRGLDDDPGCARRGCGNARNRKMPRAAPRAS